ncbi:transmembrane protein 245-like isoform X2 [Paramacrobiotus metropolitanus]|uniref:transmembrane protein 245-like isoform X2 n=1 Tax=Paramacrobiotus metropolitanus TaxID=2943436 RepID=UPI0024460C6B|nr:transmembrane protein 245-like isoform X2 [Paramacrobiotus metropolitanus]
MPTVRTRHHSRVTESWNNFVALVAQASSGHEVAFRQALFTAVGQFFLVLVLLVGYQVYFILQTFLKPLAWAALSGTILFPLKAYLAHGIRGWILRMKASRTPLVVGLVITPFKLVDAGFNYFGAEVLEFLLNHYVKIFWGIVVMAGYLIGQVALWNHMEFLMKLSAVFGRILGFFSSKAIWFLIFPYIVAVNSLWTPQHRATLRMLAWPLWIWLGLHLCSLLGSMAAPVLIVTGVVLCLGFVTEMKVVKGKILRSRSMKTMNQTVDSPDEITEDADKISDSFWKVLTSSFYHLVNDSLIGTNHSGGEGVTSDDEEPPAEQTASPIPIPSALTAAGQLKLFAVNQDAAQGTRYMLYLFWMFVLVEVLSHYYMIPVILIPVAYRLVRTVGQKRGAWIALAEYFWTLRNQCVRWVMTRKDVVAPTPLRGLMRLAKQGDHKVMSVLEDCVDETVSLMLVLMMFITMGICGIITTMQVQQETVYLVGLSGNFLNETIVKHPELLEWLPEGAQVQETVQSAMDSVYMYARDWMIGTMRDAIADTNLTRVALIEKDILAIADRVYRFYVPRNDYADHPHSLLRQSSVWGNRSLQHPLSSLLTSEDEDGSWLFNFWSQFNDTWHKAASALDWSNISSYVKDNLETLTSIAESVWNVCKGNFSMLFSLVTTILSIIVMYFSALMHFILCIFVYIAALYYLLVSSKDSYRPLEFVGMISPRIAEYGHVAEIIEQTIRFIPSVMAAMLAVCPLVPPYVMAIPAVCELWFIRGEYVPAVLLVIMACTPSMFVDIAIYGDVKTTHPYMFGLSVAGGLVTMGLEGAVFGPVMLCILLVVVQVYRRILQPTTERASVSVSNLMVAPLPTSLPTLSNSLLPTPSTPDMDIARGISGFLDRQESQSSYTGALFATGEKVVESSATSTTTLDEEPKAEALSSSRRRERLHHSTPRDSASFSTNSEFGQSPIAHAD